MQFLRGLNEQYNNVRSHVLLMDPIPTIPKIFSYVAQQERQLTGNNSLPSFNLETKEGPSINVVKSVCEFCGRIGHNESVAQREKEWGVGRESEERLERSSVLRRNRVGKAIQILRDPSMSFPHAHVIAS